MIELLPWVHRKKCNSHPKKGGKKENVMFVYFHCGK